MKDPITAMFELGEDLANVKKERDELQVKYDQARDALEYGITVVCNAKEHTTDDPEVWREVMKRFLDAAHAAGAYSRSADPG